MSYVFVFTAVLFVATCVLLTIAIKQSDDNTKLDLQNRFNEELISRQTKTNKAYGECLRAIIIECHGIIGEGISQQKRTVQQEKALIAILTECSATLGEEASDTIFATLEANERSYYTLNDMCQETSALWSDFSELQAKHATEKKKRKEENSPGLLCVAPDMDEDGTPVEDSFESGNDTIPAQRLYVKRPNQV